MRAADLWNDVDPTLCPVCGRDSCEDHLPPDGANERSAVAFPDEELEDAVDVAKQGRAIAEQGVPYVLDEIIPAYGMLGFLVAYTKVGKTTFGQMLAEHVAAGRPFLGRTTAATRVLVFAAEDPPEYTAWLARHLDLERGRMRFRRLPLILNEGECARICATVRRDEFGLVLIASWQAVVRGLLRDENDNAGAVNVVEAVKSAARQTGVPWLIDAHSGKGEDQAEDADPSRAMRGASSAAGSADYTLSLRYANGPFGTRRRLSGKGRFVSFPPIEMEFDPSTSFYTVTGTTRDVTAESTWRLICETGALSTAPQSITEIGRRIGIEKNGKRLSGTHRQQIADALHGRPEVGRIDETRHGQKATCYRLLETGS
jgi:AAA domain